VPAVNTRLLIGLGVAGALVFGGITAYWFVALPASEAPPVSEPAPSARTVETIRPRRGDVAHVVDTNATLEAYETADLYPKLSGYLSEVRTDIGERVRRGQVLALISVPEMEKELAEAEAVLAAKRADLVLHRVTLERQERLLQASGTSQQLVDDARSKSGVAAAQVDLAAATVDRIKTLLEYRTIVAPFDGVVAQRQVNRGDFVQSASAGRSTPLFTVQRIDTIRVFCNVPESEVSRLIVGQRARVEPFALTGQAFEGIVMRFEGRLNPDTRTMRTEIDLPNPKGVLYPGMYARVSLETDVRRGVLTLPPTSVLTDANGAFVYVVDQGRVRRQTIMTGLVEGTAVEINGGLPEDAEVVVIAQGAPPPGTIVRTVGRGPS
jgi:RND family efflux transporter MFP subunit